MRYRQQHRAGKENGSEQKSTGLPLHEAPRPDGDRFLSEYHHVFRRLGHLIDGIFGKIDAICPDDDGQSSLIKNKEWDQRDSNRQPTIDKCSEIRVNSRWQRWSIGRLEIPTTEVLIALGCIWPIRNTRLENSKFRVSDFEGFSGFNGNYR